MISLQATADAGARTLLIGGDQLNLPMYTPNVGMRRADAPRLVDELRQADGIIIGSPSYHGGISGLVKNALDYVEDMKLDRRPYWEGRVVGCIATGGGWQGAVATLSAMRAVVHSLRGWNTPLGVAINTEETRFDDRGACEDARVCAMLASMGTQIVEQSRHMIRAGEGD